MFSQCFAMFLQCFAMFDIFMKEYHGGGNVKITEIYNDGTNAKKWIEKNLFGKEVFKIRLEAYIKNKTDVLSFIKKETFLFLV